MTNEIFVFLKQVYTFSPTVFVLVLFQILLFVYGVLYLFRKPIQSVMLMFSRKKLSEGDMESHEKKKSESDENGQWATRTAECLHGFSKRVIYDMPEKIIVTTPTDCAGKLDAIIKSHRACGEAVVFNFAQTKLINRHFMTCFTDLLDQVIVENNISVKIILPNDLKSPLSDEMIRLKSSIINAVHRTKTKTIEFKIDEKPSQIQENPNRVVLG